MFSIESQHRGDSSKYTQYTIFNTKKKKKKITLNYLKSAAMGFFEKTEKQVQNSHGKQAITARAPESLL